MDILVNVFDKIVIIIPSLNPDEKLKGTVKGLIEQGFKDIVLVNDGSDAEHSANFPSLDEFPQCSLLVHEVNRGKGAALKTAFSYVLETRTDCLGVITVDGDGQHLPKDVLACANRLAASPDALILGVRDFSLPGVPPKSRFGNKLTSTVFRFGCGLKISDTQTGLRAIPFGCLGDFLEINGDRFEYETNMLLELKKLRIPVEEQVIETVYEDGNKATHFHPIRDSFRIYRRIFLFMFSSISAAAIDFVAFFLLLTFLNESPYATLISTAVARVISSIYNYLVNKKLVFGSKKSTITTLVRYYILAAFIMVLSGTAVDAVSALLAQSEPIIVTGIKFVIDMILFAVSFFIQKSWFFGKKKIIEKE